MIYTRQQLIEKIKQKDVEFFQNGYFRYDLDKSVDFENKFEVVWDLNWGDGNEWLVALKFINEDLTILLEGYYSSHDSSEFSKVSLSVPFEFKETRYRSATPDEIRDMRIDEILS